MTYKELAKIISELPETQQNEDVSIVWETGDVYQIGDFMAAGEIDNQNLQDEVVSTLHEDHFILIPLIVFDDEFEDD